MGNQLLGGFETLLLLAIIRLGDQAYGVTIRKEVLQTTGRDIAVGAIYTGLGRLQRKGLVDSWTGEPTPERGGRAKRFYRVTANGLEFFHHKHNAMQSLLNGLDLDGEIAHA